MIHSQKSYTDKIMESLEPIGLSEKEREQVEAYLSGEKGQEVLDDLEKRDFYTLPSECVRPGSQLFCSISEKRKEEAEKLIRVFFALGQSTCAAMADINYWGIDFMKTYGYYWGLKQEEWLSVTGEVIGRNKYMLTSRWMDRIRKEAKTPEIIKTALDFCTGKWSNGSLILLAIYFIMRYPKTESEEMDEQDGELMRRYERIAVSTVESMLPPSLSESQKNQVCTALEQGPLTEAVCSMAGPIAKDDLLTRIICGIAFVNMKCSPCLKRTAELFLASNMEQALMAMEEMDIRGDLRQRGGDFDQVFHLDTGAYIAWAALKNYSNILKYQFRQNREVYLEYLKRADMDRLGRLMQVIREKDTALYRQLQPEVNRQRNAEVIEALTGDNGPETAVLREYLQGSAPLSALYLYEEDMVKNANYYRGYRLRDKIAQCEAEPENRAFVKRCMACIFLRQEGYYFASGSSGNPFLGNDEAAFAEFFKDMEDAGMDVLHLIKTFVLNLKSLYSEDAKTRCYDMASRKVFLPKLQEDPQAVAEAFRRSEAEGRRLGLMTMALLPETCRREILSYTQDTAKTVRSELLHILEEKREWREDIKALLSDKKAGTREMAVCTLAAWNDPEDRPDLETALEKEKNAKVRKLLLQVLAQEDGQENGTGAAAGGTLKKEELVKNLHKGGKKRTLSWAFETPFPQVRRKNGETAGDEYLQAFLLSYAGMGSNPGVSQDAAFLAEDLNETELAVYVNELFDRWMEQGAEAKKKWVLYAAAVHGGSLMVKKLSHQIQEWPANARGAMACEAVRALALSPEPEALLKVDSIASKFKFRQIRAAASNALDFAASQLGMTREELSDRIVPDLGFDERMERQFDYGSRSFIVTITPELEIQVRDQEGKKLKNMPAPGKRDEQEKAALAYEEFKSMKKQMKAVVSNQKQRLEQALSAKRLWKKEDWLALFTKKPVMHPFAIGLIWGIYKEETLTDSFRYMEDGSLNTADEEEYELPKEARIGLVHPVELTKEELEAWKGQLEDYEIIQPISQLDRPVYRLEEEEKGKKSLERFEGIQMNDLSLIGKMQSLGWYTGSVQDAGCFFEFYREDRELGAELHFSGTYIAGQNEEVTVESVRFYRAGEVKRGSYVYDEADDNKALFLDHVPARYFSEIVLQLSKATASGSRLETDGNKG